MSISLKFIPAEFGWSPPWLEHQIKDEPDGVGLVGHINYDFRAGRLGSSFRLSLTGSDDDTGNRLLVRTECIVPLSRDNIPVDAKQMVVRAVFECVECFTGDTNTFADEYGPSTINALWSSRPYALQARIDNVGVKRSGQTYSANDAENLVRVTYWGTDFPYGSGILGAVGASDIKPKQKGDRVVFTVELEEIPPQDVDQVIIGIEDEIAAASNDVSYELELRSHWLLLEVEVVLL
jgi:hypothetical protein